MLANVMPWHRLSRKMSDKTHTHGLRINRCSIHYKGGGIDRWHAVPYITAPYCTHFRARINQEGDIMELTLKQYADQLNISYEAVRASFKIHEGKDLIPGTHYRKSGRTRILLQPGIDLMNSYRGHPLMPVAVPEEVDRLHEEIQTLQAKITELDAELSAAHSEIASQSLQITELTAKLAESKDALITALYQIQNLQGRLIEGATTEPKDEEEPRRGFFARIFGRK